ncbi:hypothetical protein N7478_010885 [Penicillium angulare]|uniref:uncharacterized protein n=1 Tax=Penicillium angulare TaxID=116970 RepID=UPI0025423F11|nr:uncharacterized protein N7478_010885 [Penicillium angulare]KAJ5263280.1 hypothetical protein N7478_010885 [Penicillium angulare]
MKFFNLSISTLPVLIYAVTVSGTPAANPSVALLTNTAVQLEATPSSRAGASAWDFRLYKNHKCSGSAKNFTGSGSTDCRSDIHGSVLGFIRVDVDPSCDIMLYKDSKCSKGDSIGSISYDTADTCTASRKKKKIKSFRVTCLG